MIIADSVRSWTAKSALLEQRRWLSSSRPSDNPDEAAPPASEGLAGPAEYIAHQNIKIEDTADW